MSTEIDPKLLEKLSLMLYPENLEQYSKVLSILSEDFTFKGEDLFALKEVSKLFSTKEMLYSYLTHLSKMPKPILSVNEDFSKCEIILNDNLLCYQFINIPPDYNCERIKLLLEIKEDDILRLYQSSIFWNLISDKKEFNDKFEKTLGSITVDKEDKKLKYNITSAYMIKKMAKKAIEKRQYNKETEDLKNNNNRKSSDKPEEFNRSKKSDDSMSWRKKSDEQDELGYGYSNKYQGSNRRKRFKSDPNEYYDQNQGYDYYNYNNKKKNYNQKYNEKKDIEELKIELDDVKYPIFIKQKYTNKEMLDFYAQMKNDIHFDEKNFVNVIDDIIDKKNMKNLELENKKEYEVPKNNPLLNFKRGK